MSASLQTARLLLRPFEPSDAADVFAYASNPNVSQYTSWVTHRTVADADAFIAMVLARDEHDHTWAIRLLDDTRVIGAIEFGCESETEAEVHYVLAEDLWNRGLMTEAVRAVLDWGRARYPSLRHIGTRAMTGNVASQRVMEKCGLQFEGVRMIASAKHGKPIEHNEYGIAIRPTAKRDLEIYVRDCSIDAVLAWAAGRVGPLGAAQDGGAATIYPTSSGAMIVTPAIEDGPFTGVAFNATTTPWASDDDCARDAARALGRVVRCVPGKDYPEVPEQSSTWLEVSTEGQRLVEWE